MRKGGIPSTITAKKKKKNSSYSHGYPKEMDGLGIGEQLIDPATSSSIGRVKWTKVTSTSIQYNVRKTKKRPFTNNQWRNVIVMSLLPDGKTKILSLIPHRGITNTTLKPPLKHLQWLGRRNKCIYSNTPGPEKVRIFYTIYSHILLSGLPFLF